MPATCVTVPINTIANILFVGSMKAVFWHEVVREAFKVFGRTAVDIIKPSAPFHKCRHVRFSAYTLQSCGYGRKKVCASRWFHAYKMRRHRMWPCVCCVQDSVSLENAFSEIESKSISKMRISKRYLPPFHSIDISISATENIDHFMGPQTYAFIPTKRSTIPMVTIRLVQG